MENKNNQLSHLFYVACISSIFPLLFFLLSWFGSVGRIPENRIFLVAILGLLWGILLDILVLKRILAKLYTAPLWLMGLVYLFYSLVLYGFFMGLPVFHVFLAIPGGYYMGLRSRDKQEPESNRLKFDSQLFTYFVLFALCVLTAILALSEKTMGTQLQKMLGLPFVVTKSMIWILIVFGMSLLLTIHRFFWVHYFTKAREAKEQNIV